MATAGSAGPRRTGVMLVDDQPLARRGFALMLRKADHIDVAAGASGFLSKDIRTAQLVTAVDAVAQGDEVLTPRITRQVIDRGVPRTLPPVQRERMHGLVATLSPREFDIARPIADRLSNGENAGQLFIEPASARRNVSRILVKLELRDRVQIAVAWYRSGL